MKFPSDVIVHFESNKKGTEVTMSGWKEVVRCKDCKLNKSEVDWVECPMSGMYGRKAFDNYCSLAERKEND